jgi:AP endonuclease-1
LRGLHLNDSKVELGSKKDRHENIGKGQVGLEVSPLKFKLIHQTWLILNVLCQGFRAIMNEPRFQDLPLILETPASDNGGSKAARNRMQESYATELKLLHSLENTLQR